MSDAQVEAVCGTIAMLGYLYFMYKFSRND